VNPAGRMILAVLWNLAGNAFCISRLRGNALDFSASCQATETHRNPRPKITSLTRFGCPKRKGRPERRPLLTGSPTAGLPTRAGCAILPRPQPPPWPPWPLDTPRPDFRLLAPWPPGTRFLNGRTERILQNQLPPRPDARSYAGSTADLAANSEFAERSAGDFAAEHRARDAERQRRKRAGKAAWREG
jgi:hypothetical protein